MLVAIKAEEIRSGQHSTAARYSSALQVISTKVSICKYERDLFLFLFSIFIKCKKRS
jgi:hypothetical protein